MAYQHEGTECFVGFRISTRQYFIDSVSSATGDLSTMVKRLGYLLLLLFAFVSYSPNQLRAEEPASRFLQELRNQRYFELAEYYLDLQVGKEMLSDEFRAKIDLERAMVILSGARNIANGTERDKKFEEAQTLLERFSAATEDTDLKIQSNNLVRWRITLEL